VSAKEGLLDMNVPTYCQPQATPMDAALADISRRVLSDVACDKHPLVLCVRDAGQDKVVKLPASAVSLLLGILEAMAAGRGITVVADDAELTTVQAADALNVSRTFLINLLETGIIAHRKVGTHRRIRLQDVMAYKERIDREREATLDVLVREAQEQNMGY